MSEQEQQTASEGIVGQSASTGGLERKPLGLAEFIEQCGGFKLKPYQREMVAAIERGERLMLDPVTMREPYREWKERHSEYVTAIMRSNGSGERGRACATSVRPRGSASSED